MIESREGDESRIGYAFGALFGTKIDGIGFSSKEQNWHGDGRQNIVKAKWPVA